MYRDPIVEETRKLREEYAAQFNHDLDAIFADIQKRQRQSTEAIGAIVSRLLALDPYRVVLFGSHATGTQDSDSDVDLLDILDSAWTPC